MSNIQIQKPELALNELNETYAAMRGILNGFAETRDEQGQAFGMDQLPSTVELYAPDVTDQNAYSRVLSEKLQTEWGGTRSYVTKVDAEEGTQEEMWATAKDGVHNTVITTLKDGKIQKINMLTSGKRHNALQAEMDKENPPIQEVHRPLGRVAVRRTSRAQQQPRGRHFANA